MLPTLVDPARNECPPAFFLSCWGVLPVASNFRRRQPFFLLYKGFQGYRAGLCCQMKTILLTATIAICQGVLATSFNPLKWQQKGKSSEAPQWFGGFIMLPVASDFECWQHLWTPLEMNAPCFLLASLGSVADSIELQSMATKRYADRLICGRSVGGVTLVVLISILAFVSQEIVLNQGIYQIDIQRLLLGFKCENKMTERKNSCGGVFFEF